MQFKKGNMCNKLYSKNANNFVFALFLACEFYFGLMYGYASMDVNKAFFPMVAFILYMALDKKTKKNPFDFHFFILVVIYFFIGIYNYMDNPYLGKQWNNIPYAWIIPTGYFLGKIMIGNSKKEIEKRGFLILVVLASAMYLQGILNYFALFLWGHGNNTYDFDPNSESRTFWNPMFDGTRNTWVNGFLLIIGGFFYSFLKRREKHKNYIYFWACIIIANIINIAFAGRQLIFIFIVPNILIGFFYLADASNKRIYRNNKKIIVSLLFLLFVALVLIIMIKLDAFGIQEIYNNSFLSRDGGIIHNVRFQMWKSGIERSIEFPKGGWNLWDLYGNDSTHLAWLEYSRVYDVNVGLLWAVFWICILVSHFLLLKKHGRKYTILYFSVGVELTIFIYSLIEPVYIYYKDLMLFVCFTVGITSGIGDLAASGDYELLNKSVASNKKRYYAVGLGYLFFALLMCSYWDWRVDRFNLILGFILPVIMYVIGGMLYKNNLKYFMVGMLAIASLVTIISNGLNYFALIIPGAILIGFVCWKFNFNKVILSIITIVANTVAVLLLFNDGRLAILKEAIRLQLGMGQGYGWILSGDNVAGITYSSSLWLDYARDYGIIVLGILLAFEIWMVVCLVKLVFNNSKELIHYILIEAFILLNFYYMFNSNAYNNKILFAIGLGIYGMITSIVTDDKEDSRFKWGMTKAR